MLDFLIRVNNGKWQRPLMSRLLDKNLQELDLVSCEFDPEDYHHLITTCTNLPSLSLGATTDAMIKELITHNPGIEQLSVYASKNLTNKGVKMIAEYCSKLQVCNLTPPLFYFLPSSLSFSGRLNNCFPFSLSLSSRC